jgi:hypothetical protein
MTAPSPTARLAALAEADLRWTNAILVHRSLIREVVAELEAAQAKSDEAAREVAPAISDVVVVIWSGEHRAYWLEGGAGYTRYLAKAGRYSLTYAQHLTAHFGPEKQIELVPAPTLAVAVSDVARAAAQRMQDRCAEVARSESRPTGAVYDPYRAAALSIEERILALIIEDEAEKGDEDG